MDKMVYLAMAGAKQIFDAQTANNNNLANATTPGFRASFEAFKSLPVYGPGHASRVYAVANDAGLDLSSGPLMTTGRDLDVAVRGEGYIAVQAPDGTEAYTRAGDLHVTETGLLETGAGHLVLGESGPVVVPPSSKIEVGRDGTVSLIPLGLTPNTVAVIDRIKLVNPPSDQLYKGEDGLLRVPEGTTVAPDASVQLVSGALESSNVNAAEALVNMISLARQFEMHVKALQTAEQNDETSAKLLRME
ncbi:MAG: flagellar basal body rod protein FlgF [Pseudomonadota bacterium]|nr:flagellar basal body rod protein FlgF [Pseudomonadota bacterium]